MRSVPDRYSTAFNRFGKTEVKLGDSGLELFPPASLDRRQPRDPGWQPEWLVIGREHLLDAPIFLDTADPDLHVLTAIPGEQEWQPYPIATSVEAFFATLLELANSGYREDYPAMFRRVAELNENPEVVAFWMDFFDYEEGGEDEDR